MTQTNHVFQADGTAEEEFARFLKDYPTYKETSILDELRRKDYSRLDEQDHIYLD